MTHKGQTTTATTTTRCCQWVHKAKPKSQRQPTTGRASCNGPKPPLHVSVTPATSAHAWLEHVRCTADTKDGRTNPGPPSHRLKSCSTRLSVLLKVADRGNGGVFMTPNLLFPLLFFLGVRGFEGGGLTPVEVERRPLEESYLLRYENVLDTRSYSFC